MNFVRIGSKWINLDQICVAKKQEPNLYMLDLTMANGEVVKVDERGPCELLEKLLVENQKRLVGA